MEIPACLAMLMTIPLTMLLVIALSEIKRILNFFAAPFRMLKGLFTQQNVFKFPQFIGSLTVSAAIVLFVVFHPVKIVPCHKSAVSSELKPVDRKATSPRRPTASRRRSRGQNHSQNVREDHPSRPTGISCACSPNTRWTMRPRPGSTGRG